MDAVGKRRLEFLIKEVRHVVDYVRSRKQKWKVVYPE